MYLDTIIHHKRREIASLPRFPGKRTREIHDPAGFLEKKPVIAEIKKSSPSEGVIQSDPDIIGITRQYQAAGAGAISVLTDRRFFSGDISDIKLIAEHIEIPILCKDFILDEVQILNAFTAGADMVLLVAAALGREELKRLSYRARSLGLTVLYEIHTLEEFEKIENLNPRLVGVNSRNLRTFRIDMNGAAEILSSLRGNFLRVAESGISGPEDIAFLKRAGAEAFLVGTLLMRSADPEALIAELTGAAL